MPTEMLQALLIPFLGTALGAGCVFFIRGNLEGRARLHRICCRGHGSCFHLEPDHPGHGAVKSHGKAGVSAGVGRILVRRTVYSAAGSHHPPSAQGK